MSALSCVSPSEEANMADLHDDFLHASNYEKCDNTGWQNSASSSEPIPPESVPYYYEDISRETADLVLWDRGCVDGMYLLRKSTNRDADYVLSLCFNNSVLHYRLKTFPDGLVGLTGMPRQKFAGPVELINNVEGVACKPRIPCCRISSQFCNDLYFGLTKEEARSIMKQKANEWGINEDKLDSQHNENYGDLKSLILKTVHEFQPWFHGTLTREEAERSMETHGHSDGKFLVRERDDCSYALCVSINKQAKHYKIDVLPSGQFAIQAGQKFPNLMALVRHYMVCSDGLKVTLKNPFPKTIHESSASAASSSQESADNSPKKVASVANEAAFNIYSNQPSIMASKRQNGFKGQHRKISLPENSKSSVVEHRLSASDLMSPTSSRKLVDELQNLSVMMPSNGQSGCIEDCKHTPVPAPRLSLGTRSRSVDANQDNTPIEIDDGRLPGESSGGFLHKLFGRTHKMMVTQAEPDNSDIKKNVETRPQPLPRKKLIKDVKSEESIKLDSIGEASSDGGAEHQSSGNSHNEKATEDETLSTTEPVYVEIDPTIEEEPNDVHSSVNWQTNIEYEPLTSGEHHSNSPLARSASAPGHQPIEQDDVCTGAKPKVSSVVNDSSKSISPRLKNLSHDIGDKQWDDEPRTPPPVPVGAKLKRRWSKEKSESIYRTIRRYRKNFINLDRKNIKIEEKIGCGNFGDVMRASYSCANGDMDLAVKTVKTNAIGRHKNEIIKEARTMANFDHCHIVRLIGVCEGDPFMLVMELAPLGPLHKFLNKHRQVPRNDVIMLIEQVAMAMEYLESKQYVHRDLAARNVLLVNDKFAKISDFGMSRALGIGRDYYRAAESGKWPLKWYAPECIYYFKFSSKSDVWSFGVTLWEAMSYGEKPYKGMVGKEILEMFHRDERLAQPIGCPDKLYQVMRQCWQIKPEDRPDFSQLRQTLHNFTSS